MRALITLILLLASSSWGHATSFAGTGDSTSHLLVLQQFDIQTTFGRPSGAGDMAQPGCGEIECRLPIRERTDDAGSPPDLA
jgi:hypothetical protein